MAAPDLWTNFGAFGAQGVTGAEALVYEINRIVYTTGIASPVTSNRGFSARLNYLNSEAGREALGTHGVSERALRSWKQGKANPSPASREKVDNAYWERRRENLLRSGHLKRLLNNGGRGRPVEIYPVDQSQVNPNQQRSNITQRSLPAVRYIWDDLVDAWGSQDLGALDDIWDDVIQDLDSEYVVYAYVTSIGIGA